MKIDESVIDKVLDNKAAPGEARKVAGWFVTEEGRKYLSGRLDREMEELAEEMPEDVRLPSISGMKMKQRFMSEIKRERGRRSVGRKWMWVAAVLLPFVLLSVSLLFLVNRTGIFSETEYAEISVPYGEQMRVILQDGSIVHLNSDSRLRYPKQFGLFNRTVELWGEGYFNVARDENRPFKVDLQGVEVRVTGTKFNVKAYKEADEVITTLVEGKVNFEFNNASQQPQYIVMAPGQKLVYYSQNGKTELYTTSGERELSWKDGKIIFHQTSLRDALDILADRYNAEFVIQENVPHDDSFSGTFTNRNLEQVLNFISASSKVRWRYLNNNADAGKEKIKIEIFI